MKSVAYFALLGLAVSAKPRVDINALINDGIKIYNEAKNHQDIGSLVQEGLTDVQQLTQQNQLWDVQDAWNGAVQAGQGAVNYAMTHPQEIAQDVATGVQIAKVVGSLAGYVEQGDDDELFGLKDIVRGAAHVGEGAVKYAVSHPQQIAQDVATGVKIAGVVGSLAGFAQEEETQLWDVQDAWNGAVQAGQNAWNGAVQTGQNAVGYALTHPQQMEDDVSAGVSIAKSLASLRNYVEQGDDDEFFGLSDVVRGAEHVGEGAVKYAVSHPQQIAQDVATGVKIAGVVGSLAGFVQDGENDEFFDFQDAWNGAVQAGQGAVNYAVTHPQEIAQDVATGVQIAKVVGSLAFDAEEDTEFFDAQDAWNNAVNAGQNAWNGAVQAGQNAVGYAVAHPQQMEDDVQAGVNIIKSLQSLRSEELMVQKGFLSF